MKALLIAVSAALVMTHVAATEFRTQQNVSVELTFHAVHHVADPFNQVTLDAMFTDPMGTTFRVPAFWDGGDVWKARYASRLLGRHRYQMFCSDASDTGLNGQTGFVTVTKYTGKNPLFKDGPLVVAPDKRHLQHADGAPFFWLGDTWWMGLAKRLQWPGEFHALTQDRVKKGFNVVQIVAGLYPDMFPFDPRGANEAGYPWEADYKAINPAYFDHADERIRYLIANGITPCIVGSWGFFMTWMTPEQLEQHWRNLIARYGSMPVVWCGCGEVDMPWYLAKRGEYNRQDRMNKWTEVVRYIRRTDPFHRLLTLHPDGYSARDTINDASLLDFDMLQTGHGEEDAAKGAAKATAATYNASPTMPYIDGESSYEMLNDSMPTSWTRAMFWISMLNGAAGHTYGANGIWQNNRPGDPHGKSPHGGTWGKIPSSVAMHLPGSSQMGYGKKLFLSYPWTEFRPHPEWAAYAPDKTTSDGGGIAPFSKWIWYPEGKPAINAPVATRYFRSMHFGGVKGENVSSVRLRITADDAFVAYLNGKKVAESSDWRVGADIADVSAFLRSGDNVLAVRAENRDASVQQNPAGLIATFEIGLKDQLQPASGLKYVITSGLWKVSKTESPGWTGLDFDDSAWQPAMEVARYGEDPWGRFADPKPPVPVLSAGIDGRVRFTYVLLSQPIVEANLGPDRKYDAKFFDPVTGGTTAFGSIVSDKDGTWVATPPKGWTHDWVLILEAKAH